MVCFAKTPAALKRLTFHDPSQTLPVMILTILRLFSLIPSALRLRSDLALENLALRQQLAVQKRQLRRPKLRWSDRFFWLLLSDPGTVGKMRSIS